MSLPVGLVRDLSGRVVKHPDQEVRERIDFVFATFLRVKSIHGVVRELAAARLLLPRRERGRDDGAVGVAATDRGGGLELAPQSGLCRDFRLRPNAVRPACARRTAPQAPLASGAVAVHGPRQVPRVHRPRDLRDDPGDAPRQLPGVQPASEPRGGSVRVGALLQGLAYCGHCGRKMTVQYHAAARYLCSGHKEQGGGPECQRIPIAPVDAWVVQSFWEALAPAELDRYDAAVAALDDQRRQIRRARDLQLERLRYEARLAEKQYRLVDPENRLVAAELERRWEQALRAVRQAEEESQVEEADDRPCDRGAAPAARRGPPDVAADVGRGPLSNIRKKELLRTVIDKVVLQRPVGDSCEIRIVWKGGDWTTIALDLPVVTYAEMANGEELVAEVLRRARAGQSDRQIAAELTAAGYHAPLKKWLSVDSVVRIRLQHGVYSRKTEFLRQGLAGLAHPGPSRRAAGRAQVMGLLPDPKEAITDRSRSGDRPLPDPRRQAKSSSN